jgi:hypothetical protein
MKKVDHNSYDYNDRSCDDDVLTGLRIHGMKLIKRETVPPKAGANVRRESRVTYISGLTTHDFHQTVENLEPRTLHIFVN